ncbi:uncharacterized protein c19h1orf94 isoform X2 [Etheostoma spectabile]|uniref:Uncharacterized protein n=1 Tax=Etheostoma spectabile TaxID=54343 RepID=A0A5J5CYZ1_9PERO|nr:uncharacterized protein LOC116701982 isoform X2 [Etheostoma spectabile]KAA8586103.1 hypothetical protein FQN60_007672 [Etheostoma spectabile]
MMLRDAGAMSLTSKQIVSAFAPFPRCTWTHPHVPNDNFDRVCKNIWRRAREATEELARGQSSPQNKDSTAPDSKPNRSMKNGWMNGLMRRPVSNPGLDIAVWIRSRAEEQQKETDDLGLSTYEKDKQQCHAAFTLPCPYLSGRRHPNVAKPARVLIPVMEKEMKRNEEEATRKRNLEKDVSDKQKIWVPQPGSRRDKPQPQETYPVCSATEDHAPPLQVEEDPPHPSKLPRDTCESEDETNISSSSGCVSSDDDDCVTLPGVRRCATDSSDGDSESENKQELPSYSTEKDFPPLSTIKDGTLPCSTEPPALWKVPSQWELPLLFHPDNTLTATVAETQHVAYDLLADFPALQPPKKPLALGVLLNGNPKTKGASWKRGLTHSQTQRQESGASNQRRKENVPHEVSSICAGDQKSVLCWSGQRNSPAISCEELKANNQPPPIVAGTDGVDDISARSWASAARAGMKQAAAPQEKARPCTFQHTVPINRTKAGCSAAQNFPNKVTPSHKAAPPMCHGPRPRNPNQFVRPGYPPTHQAKLCV